MSSSYLFIVNPNARNKLVGKKWLNVEPIIKSKEIDHEIIFTEYQGHAIEIAKDRHKDFDVVVATGGDGTINEVINGLYESNTAFAPLALGNGNDFAHLLGYDANYKQSLDIILQHNIHSVPVGIAKGDEHQRYFVNIGELGITSLVAKDVYRKFKWIKGLAKYYVVGLMNIVTYSKVPAKIMIDDTYSASINLVLLACGFGYRFGGGFNVLPNNSFTHGDFGICVTSNLAKLKMFDFINKLKAGTHVKNTKYVSYLRGKEVTIELERPLPVEVEGEIFAEKATTASFSIADYKQPVLLNPRIIKQEKEGK